MREQSRRRAKRAAIVQVFATGVAAILAIGALFAVIDGDYPRATFDLLAGYILAEWCL